MPSVHLRAYETEEEQLPEVCMCCGDPATIHRYRTFKWNPPWVVLFLLLGILPGLIMALVLTRRMRVLVPFCDRHKYHWLLRTTIMLAGILVPAVPIFLLAIMDAREFMKFILLLPLSFLTWLIAYLVLSMTSIRPTEITESGITLTGVCQRFIDALVALRVEDRQFRRRFREESWESEPSRPRDVRPSDDDRIRREGGEAEDRYRD